MRRVLEGRPSVVVRDGNVLHDVLRLQRMTLEEIHEAGRKRGYDTLDDLAWVIVETDGKFTFLERRNDASDGSSDDDPDDDEGEPHT